MANPYQKEKLFINFHLAAFHSFKMLEEQFGDRVYAIRSLASVDEEQGTASSIHYAVDGVQLKRAR